MINKISAVDSVELWRRRAKRWMVPIERHVWLYEFLVFGIKQAWSCVFGGLLLAVIIASAYWNPFPTIHRYDLIFIAAIVIQALLLIAKLESWAEARLILVFHFVATVMELFKTAPGIQSWIYQGEAVFQIGNVPLFAGFMYSAVGSYIARAFRVFKMRCEHYPAAHYTLLLAALIYINFFSHHYIVDFRNVLLAAIVILFWRTRVYFVMVKAPRWMPLLLGWFLVAFFIWTAENIGTYTRAWSYPNQIQSWKMVSLHKLEAWFLLAFISWVLVGLVHRQVLYPSSGDEEKCTRDARD